MNWRSEVIAAVQRGVRGACLDIPRYTENWSGTLAAEYLLTVRVAEAIRDLNKQQGGIRFPFKVYIEERTPDFIRKCLPVWPVIKDVQRRKRIYRAVECKGKVDIAVTHDASPGPGAIPVCVIEIKGFDPAPKKIRDDLVRNANFMAVAALTSRNNLFTSLVALHEGEAVRAADRQKDINRAKKDYRRAVRRLRSRLLGIEVEYEVFSAEEEFGRVADPLDIGEDCRHHFVGVIVSFHRAASEL